MINVVIGGRSSGNYSTGHKPGAEPVIIPTIALPGHAVHYSGHVVGHVEVAASNYSLYPEIPRFPLRSAGGSRVANASKGLH